MEKSFRCHKQARSPHLRQKAWAWREWASHLGPEPASETGKVDFALWEFGLGVVVPSLWEAQRDAICLSRGQEVPLSGLTQAVLLAISPDSEGLLLTRTGASLGIPHPLELEEEALQAWSQIFADYQILQPFPQLGRPIHRLNEEEKASLELQRQRERKVHPGQLLNLEERGWVRGQTLDGGCCTRLRRPLGSNFMAELEFHDGIFVGALQQSGDQTLGPLRLERQGQPRCWGELDPIGVSEILADLEVLR